MVLRTVLALAAILAAYVAAHAAQPWLAAGMGAAAVLACGLLIEEARR
jgi:hypothetical protein